MEDDIKMKISKEKFLFILNFILECLFVDNARKEAKINKIKKIAEIKLKNSNEIINVDAEILKKKLFPLTIKDTLEKLIANKLDDKIMNELIDLIQEHSAYFLIKSNDKIKDTLFKKGIISLTDEEIRIQQENDLNTYPSTSLDKKQCKAILVMIFIYLLAMRKDPKNEKYKEAWDIINQNKSFKDIILKEPEFSINTNELESIKNCLRKQIKKNEGMHLFTGMLNVLKNEDRECGINFVNCLVFFLGVLGVITCLPLVLISYSLAANSKNGIMTLIELLAASTFGLLGLISLCVFCAGIHSIGCDSLNGYCRRVENERNQIIKDYSTLLFDPEVVDTAIFSLQTAAVDDKYQIIIPIDNNSLFDERNKTDEKRERSNELLTERTPLTGEIHLNLPNYSH